MDLSRLADPFPTEEWRPIEGLPHYSVSSHGRVRSEPRTCIQPPRYPEGRTYSGRILQTFINENGYEIASLTYPNGKKKVRVHRLVAVAFLGVPPEQGMDVNHKNGKRADNRAANLEWCTRSENLLHGYRVNRTPHRVARGSETATAILNEDKARAIRRRVEGGAVQRQVAREFGVSVSTVHLIAKGKTWRHA